MRVARLPKDLSLESTRQFMKENGPPLEPRAKQLHNEIVDLVDSIRTEFGDQNGTIPLKDYRKPGVTVPGTDFVLSRESDKTYQGEVTLENGEPTNLEVECEPTRFIALGWNIKDGLQVCKHVRNWSQHDRKLKWSKENSGDEVFTMNKGEFGEVALLQRDGVLMADDTYGALDRLQSSDHSFAIELKD